MPGKTVGTIEYSADKLDLVHIWQYDQAPRLSALLNTEIAFAKKNIAGFYRDWFKDVFNIDTANAFGLGLWGKLFGVPRTFFYNDPDDGARKKITVSLEMYRRMLKARFFTFGRIGTVPDINHYLQMVFPSRLIFVYDNYDMTITIVVYLDDAEQSPLTDEEKGVLMSANFVPVPCGVKSNIAIIDKIFGFEGSNLHNFKGGEAPNYSGGTFIRLH